MATKIRNQQTETSNSWSMFWWAVVAIVIISGIAYAAYQSGLTLPDHNASAVGITTTGITSTLDSTPSPTQLNPPPSGADATGNASSGTAAANGTPDNNNAMSVTPNTGNTNNTPTTNTVPDNNATPNTSGSPAAPASGNSNP